MNNTDSPGKTFFSRNPFRSGFFLIEAIFSIAVILASVAILVVYRNRLSLGMQLLFFCFTCLYPAFSLAGAFSKHRKVHEAYFSGATELSADSSVHVALDVAATAINDDLSRLNSALLAFIAALAFILHKSSEHF